MQRLRAIFRRRLTALHRSINLAALLSVLLTFPALAQVDRATITGTLRDPSGAAVTITYPATGLHREVAANGSGVFLFPGLPVGHVTLDAVHNGFRSIRVEL